MKYRVVWIKSICEEEVIDADSVDEAKSKWENNYYDDGAELFLIEDENGHTTEY